MPAMTTTHVDISDPIDLAATCMQAAQIHQDKGDDLRRSDQHGAAGIEREAQRHYMKRAELHLAASQAASLQRLADALDRIALTL